jgi:hypothetical protein
MWSMSGLKDAATFGGDQHCLITRAQGCRQSAQGIGGASCREEERNAWKDVKQYFSEEERQAMNANFLTAKSRVKA